MWKLLFWKTEKAMESTLKQELKRIFKSAPTCATKFRTLVRLIEELGPHKLIMPHNKNLKGGLFELRDTQNGMRYYYCKTSYWVENEEHKIVLLLLVCGDKNNGSEQARDIEKARDRMAQINENSIESNQPLVFKDYGEE